VAGKEQLAAKPVKRELTKVVKEKVIKYKNETNSKTTRTNRDNRQQQTTE
jgi:hypothetical protein